MKGRSSWQYSSLFIQVFVSPNTAVPYSSSRSWQVWGLSGGWAASCRDRRGSPAWVYRGGGGYPVWSQWRWSQVVQLSISAFNCEHSQGRLIYKLVNHLSKFTQTSEFCFLIDKCRSHIKGDKEMLQPRLHVCSQEPTRLNEVMDQNQMSTSCKLIVRINKVASWWYRARFRASMLRESTLSSRDWLS